MKQTTLTKSATLTGTSLHEGVPVSLTLKPAKAGEGYTFIRTDKAGAKVAAHPDKIIDIKRRTVIKDGEAEVHTIEHVLSALTGLGVDNATIELNAPEPPAGDGSAKAFMDLVDQAGISPLEAEAEIFTPTAPLVFTEGNASISCTPDPKPQTPNGSSCCPARRANFIRCSRMRSSPCSSANCRHRFLSAAPSARPASANPRSPSRLKRPCNHSSPPDSNSATAPAPARWMCAWLRANLMRKKS